jgi:hypothetical protein
MEQPKQWYIFTETGEAVQAETREEAIRIIKRLNMWADAFAGSHNVLTEDEYKSGENPF